MSPMPWSRQDEVQGDAGAAAHAQDVGIGVFFLFAIAFLLSVY
jgi:hypothetical protein